MTIGDERESIADFIATLGAAGVATLIDVRDAPWSRRPEYAKRALAEALEAGGIHYVHLKGLGNPKPGRDAARAGDMAAFHAIFQAQMETEAARADLATAGDLAAGGAVCLMCYERDAARCHRSIVAQRLTAETGLAVRHLTVERPAADDAQLDLL
jgi:uncharacterized protein (DUF488 family)